MGRNGASGVGRGVWNTGGAVSGGSARSARVRQHEQPAVGRHELPGTVPVAGYHEYYHAGRWRRDDDPLVRGESCGWLAGGEWLAFDVDARERGPYDTLVRVACADGSGGGDLGIVVDNEPQVRLRFGATGGWNAWDDLTACLELPRGLSTVRLVVFDGGWRLHSLRIR